MKWKGGLACIILVSIVGCGPATTRYATKELQPPSSISAIRTKGTNKPRGKPFPLYRMPGLFGTYEQTEHDGQTLFTYSIIGWPLDLIATLTTPFWGYEKYDKLVLTGDLQGKLAIAGEHPSRISAEIAVADDDWHGLAVQPDNTFAYALDKTLDLREKPRELSSLPLRVRFPWKQDLAATGRAHKPTPDALEYRLRFSKDGSVVLLQNGKPVSALTIDVRYESVTDAERLREIAQRKVAEKASKQKVDEFLKFYREHWNSFYTRMSGQRKFVVITKYDYKWLDENYTLLQIWGSMNVFTPGGDPTPTPVDWSTKARRVGTHWEQIGD